MASARTAEGKAEETMDSTCNKVADTVEHGATSALDATPDLASRKMDHVGDVVQKASESERVRDASETPAAKAKEAGRTAIEMSREAIEALARAGNRLRKDPREFARVIILSARAKISDIGAGTVELRTRLTEMNHFLVEERRKRFAQLRSLDVTTVAAATAASTITVFETLKGAFPDFNELSQPMRAKMAMAGSRGEWRPVDVATEFYESTVPFPVRNLGEVAVERFVDGKHASHIQSVYNEPGMGMNTANIVWESAGDNISRGSADMTQFQLAQANAKNIFDATGIVLTDALQNAALAGCIGMTLEGIVSLGENLIYVYKGTMTPEEALKSGVKNVAKAGLSGAIGGLGISVAVAFGAGPALAAAAPVLVTIGGTLFAISTYQRIKTALDTTSNTLVTSTEPAV